MELTAELRELAIERVVNKMDRRHFWADWWEFCLEDHYSPAAELLTQLGFDAWIESVIEWGYAVQEAVDVVCGVVMDDITADWEYCGSDDQVRDHVENYMSDAELYEYVQDEVEQLEEAA